MSVFYNDLCTKGHFEPSRQSQKGHKSPEFVFQNCDQEINVQVLPVEYEENMESTEASCATDFELYSLEKGGLKACEYGPSA